MFTVYYKTANKKKNKSLIKNIFFLICLMLRKLIKINHKTVECVDDG